MSRPKGVSVIAVLLWLVGALNIISGVNAPDEISWFWGAVQVVTGVALIFCGAGCWQLRPWARVGTIGLMALNASGTIGIWIQYSDRIIVSRVLFPLAINVFVILYLMQAGVRAAFRAQISA